MNGLDTSKEGTGGPSVLSHRVSHGFRPAAAGPVDCFSRRERSAPIWFIRVDPPRRRKNCQLATARRVAMKMGRRLSGSPF